MVYDLMFFGDLRRGGFPLRRHPTALFIIPHFVGTFGTTFGTFGTSFLAPQSVDTGGFCVDPKRDLTIYLIAVNRTDIILAGYLG